MPLHPKGGARAGAGRKKGVPVKAPEEKIQTRQVRIEVHALELAEAEAQRQGGKASARSVIEELVKEHLGGKA